MLTETKPEETAGQRERLWTRDFILVCLVSFAAYVGFQFLLPTLPLYMKGLGGQDAEIGLILAIYSTSVLATRFMCGWALETWGGKRVMMVGGFLSVVAMLLYNVAVSVPSILLLRVFHGFGFGLVTTACWTMASELVPMDRRGEALGYFVNFSSVAMALGPGVAMWLLSAPGLPLAGFPLLFAACAASAIVGLLLTPFTRATRRSARRQVSVPRGSALEGLVCRDALPISVSMLFGAFGMGSILSFVPLYLAVTSTENVSIFFLVYAAVMTVSRPFIGMLTDRIDRRLAAVPILAVCAVGVGILGFSSALPAVLASAAISGVGYGALQPTLLVLVVEVTKPRERAAALATFMSSVDAGVAVGSTLLGVVAQFAGYPTLFLIASAMPALGLVYFLHYQRTMPSRRAVASPTAQPARIPSDIPTSASE